jgi:S1-C subfamily serine protease
MKTFSKTMIATLFALTITTAASAHDYFQQYYVNPGYNPGFTQPRLGIYGHFHFGEGMHIDDVVCGGLAEQIGLQPGEMIVAINGQSINCQHHYRQLLREAVLYQGGHVQLLVLCVHGHPRYVEACFNCGGGEVYMMH